MNIKNVRQELISLLKTCKDIPKGENFLIWGVGNKTDMNYSDIVDERLIPKAYVDNSQKGLFHNVNIISPEKILETEVNHIIVSVVRREIYDEIRNQINVIDNSINVYSLDEIILGRHFEDILKVFDMLECDDSKNVFYQIIKTRICRTSIPRDIVTYNQYFALPEFIDRNNDEVFVDCGAYVGDTVEQYLFAKSGIFKKIIALEPDIRNIKLLENRVNRLRNEWCTDNNVIEVIKGAIGDSKGEMSIDVSMNSLSTRMRENATDNRVKVYTIDELLCDDKVGFIKADIEGFEVRMLQGAKNTLKKDKPLLALCIYHKISDLYRIPLFINEINSLYKFQICHHHCSYDETVLYAY